MKELTEEEFEQTLKKIIATANDRSLNETLNILQNLLESYTTLKKVR